MIFFCIQNFGLESVKKKDGAHIFDLQTTELGIIEPK